MWHNKVMIWALMFSLIGSVAMSNDKQLRVYAQMPNPETSQTTQFHRIEQPLLIKSSVTVVGLALIGLEIWWFLLSKPKS